MKTYLHDVKLHSFHTAHHAILKNRMFFLKYLYPTNRMLYRSIIGLIVIHEPNNLSYKITCISAIKSYGAEKMTSNGVYLHLGNQKSYGAEKWHQMVSRALLYHPIL